MIESISCPGLGIGQWADPKGAKLLVSLAVSTQRTHCRLIDTVKVGRPPKPACMPGCGREHLADLVRFRWCPSLAVSERRTCRKIHTHWTNHVVSVVRNITAFRLERVQRTTWAGGGDKEHLRVVPREGPERLQSRRVAVGASKG